MFLQSSNHHHHGMLTTQILLTLIICPYQSSQLTSLLEGIQCLHRADHVYESIEEHCFRVCPYFSSSPPACLTHFGQFVRWDGVGVSDHMAVILSGAASKICSKQHVASLCCLYLVSFLDILLKSKWCNHIVVLIMLLLGRITVSFYHRLEFYMIVNLQITICLY